MSDIIYPRSPRETMDGWMYLPRYIDKIRLHLAGKLHADYQENFGNGFDGMWLKCAGVTHEQMIEVVKKSTTDGEVCDWVRKNVKKSAVDKAAHARDILNRPLANNSEAIARLKMRKEQAGMANRDDITNFVDFIDADEKRI
jgi:23S rRNA A1618 N6-methylase RlmF